ncbi:MAG: hypothetical protein KID02_04980 [Clostridiales bacterium]|nr:hypothetical protein [Clostridiales bacterium]
MSTVREFLRDSYQQELLVISQKQSERYEEALERYRDNFISEWMLLEEIEGEKEENREREVEVYDIIRAIPCNEIKEFFDKIIGVYVKWIDTYWDEALEDFQNLLKEHNLLESEYDIKERILFRGRIDKGILTPWDMFHIPFNKRYLIGNQRYSLTGQPLLYLGFSVIDILAELRRDEKNTDDLKICTYTLKNSFLVFDLRNDFYKYFTYNPLEELVKDQEVGFDINEEQLKREFFKLILASCCSFQKKKEMNTYSFCEEYVLPQILANVIKKTKYRGIIYTSTRLEPNDKGNYYNSAYKDNVAIFTQLCRTHIYDRELFDEFNVSNPIDLSNILEVKIHDLQKLCDIIKINDIEKNYEMYYTIAEEIQQEMSDIKVGKEKYLEHKIGKMHIYLIYSLLTEIKNICLVRRIGA